MEAATPAPDRCPKDTRPKAPSGEAHFADHHHPSISLAHPSAPGARCAVPPTRRPLSPPRERASKTSAVRAVTQVRIAPVTPAKPLALLKWPRNCPRAPRPSRAYSACGRKPVEIRPVQRPRWPPKSPPPLVFSPRTGPEPVPSRRLPVTKPSRNRHDPSRSVTKPSRFPSGRAVTVTPPPPSRRERPHDARTDPAPTASQSV
jgi:hypothetical protein